MFVLLYIVNLDNIYNMGFLAESGLFEISLAQP